MASILERLKRLGIGQKSPEQLQREASPVMTAMMNQRAPSYDEIMEQRRLNREQGVWYPIFDGNLRSGERLTNINGITYKIPAGIEIPPNTTGFDLSQDIPAQPQAPVPPTARPASPPPTQLIPDEGLMGRPLDMMPLVERPDLPSYMTATDMPVPVRPDMSMPRREAPIPGAGLFEPPAMEPRVEKPTLDTAIQNLMARYDALYSDQPPVAPEARMPEPRDLGLPAFTTPGYFPEGMMMPRVQQPNIQPPAIQPYQPDMFEFDYGSLNPQTAPDFSRMTDEEIDAYYSNILGY